MDSRSETELVFLSEQYKTDGYVTFGTGELNTSETEGSSNFLEKVVGVTVDEARAHLEKCVLRSEFDMEDAPYKPTKLPPPNYVYELLPLLVECNLSEADRITTSVENEEGSAKKPIGKANKIAKHSGKARRTVHAIDVHLCDSVFYRIATCPKIGELVGALTGWTDEGVGVRLLETQVWMKPPHCTVPLAFHRDTPYFGFLEPLDICTVWLTFDDISSVAKAKELGGLEYAVGSHLWSQEGGIEGVFFDRDYRSPMKKAAAEHESLQQRALQGSSKRLRAECLSEVKKECLDQNCESQQTEGPSQADCHGEGSSSPQQPPYTIHYVCVPAGGASFHNGMLWHGSGSNLSDKAWRRGIGIHYIRADAKFKPEYGVYDVNGKETEAICVGVEEAQPSADKKKPFLSAMWRPHKREGTLELDINRFPIIWPTTGDSGH